MSTEQRAPRTNRTPYIIIGVLGCLLVVLLVGFVGMLAFFLGTHSREVDVASHAIPTDTPNATASRIAATQIAATAFAATTIASWTKTPTPTPTNTPSPTPSPTPTLTPTPTYTYTMLIGRDSQDCLTAASDVPSRQGCNGSTNQQWALPTAGSALVQVVSKSGGCLATTDKFDGAPLTFSQCDRNAVQQQWKKVMFGDWYQLESQYANAMCVDVKAFDQPDVFLWTCHRGNLNNNINWNDNQLWLDSSTADVSQRVPPPVAPPGVYVTNIGSGPLVVRQDIPFSISFFNTTGVSQNNTWMVRIRRTDGGEGSGDTGWKTEDIPTGLPTLPGLKPWRIGPVCGNFTAQVVWRTSDNADAAFKDIWGRKPVMSFRIC